MRNPMKSMSEITLWPAVVGMYLRREVWVGNGTEYKLSDENILHYKPRGTWKMCDHDLRFLQSLRWQCSSAPLLMGVKMIAILRADPEAIAYRFDKPKARYKCGSDGLIFGVSDEASKYLAHSEIRHDDWIVSKGDAAAD